MKMHGEYLILNDKGEIVEIVPNTLIGEGHEMMMTALFNRDTLVDWSFRFGLFSEVPAYGAGQSAQYTTEPTIGVGGYARVLQQATGWTITQVDDTVIAESGDLAFTGVGVSFDKAVIRPFMHFRVEQPAATFTEYLASVGSAFATAKTVVAGETFTIRYRMHWK